MIVLTPRPGILDIAAYVGGESSISGFERVAKLSSNESALGPSPRAMAAVQETLAGAHRYPDGHCRQLREALAEKDGLDADRIVCGAGSDELFALLCRAYAGPDDEVVYTEHGFLIFPIATLSVGAKPIKAPERSLTANVEAILAAVSARTRIVFIANPNNPTGTCLPASELVRLRDALPENVLLVIDGAYAEFVDRPDYTTGVELIDRGNTVVTRTFSKIYGLGGLRLGWGYCPPAVADVLNRLRMPFNVSSVAQAAGYAALHDQAFVDAAVRHNCIWRSWLTAELRAMGIDVGDSEANFVLARFPGEPGPTAIDADRHLKRQGIIVRRVAAYGLPNALRISIGLEDDLRRLTAALAAFMTGDTQRQDR